MNIQKTKSNHRSRRRGTSAVEVALTLPIFVVFLAALMEFSHAMFVSHMLKAAAKSGARYGSTGAVTTAQVQTKVQSIINTSIKAGQATILVRDASVFDTANMNAATITYSTLPTVELSTIEQGHLYIVQVTVPYSQVALLPPFWGKNWTITGQSVLRHE